MRDILALNAAPARPLSCPTPVDALPQRPPRSEPQHNRLLSTADDAWTPARAIASVLSRRPDAVRCGESLAPRRVLKRKAQP